MNLRPPDDLVRQLEVDYKAMEGMMFGKPPAFKDICVELSKFEERLKAFCRFACRRRMTM